MRIPVRIDSPVLANKPELVTNSIYKTNGALVANQAALVPDPVRAEHRRWAS